MVIQGLQQYGIGKYSNFCIGVLQNASNEPNEAHSSQTVSPYLKGTISAGYKDASHAFAMLAPHACAADDSPTFPGRKRRSVFQWSERVWCGQDTKYHKVVQQLQNHYKCAKQNRLRYL